MFLSAPFEPDMQGNYCTNRNETLGKSVWTLCSSKCLRGEWVVFLWYQAWEITTKRNFREETLFLGRSQCLSYLTCKVSLVIYVLIESASSFSKRENVRWIWVFLEDPNNLGFTSNTSTQQSMDTDFTIRKINELLLVDRRRSVQLTG